MYGKLRLNVCLWLGIIVGLGWLAACSDASDSGSSAQHSIVLLDLLPASTRSFFQISAMEESADVDWSESDDAIPWRHIPADILRYYSGGMDLVGAA